MNRPAVPSLDLAGATSTRTVRSVVVVANPTAGGFGAGKLARFTHRLDSLGIRSRVELTRHAGHMTDIAERLPDDTDVLVVCGDLEPGATSVDTPSVLFEVMSPGSESRDRFEKWRVYQQLASLQHYVLIERDKPVVEVFDRAGEAWFTQRLIEGLGASLDLASLDLSIPLAEIYRDVLKPGA